MNEIKNLIYKINKFLVRVKTLIIAKAVFGILLEVINANVYHEEPLIFIEATFRVRLICRQESASFSV